MGKSLTVDNDAENGAARLREIEESLESDFKDYIHYRDRILAQLLEVREKRLYQYHGEEGGRRFTFEDWLDDMDSRLGLKFAARQTFYTILDAFEEWGVFGLADEQRGRRGPVKLTADDVVLIETWARDEPGLSGRAIAERLFGERGIAVHRRTIERLVARAGKQNR